MRRKRLSFLLALLTTILVGASFVVLSASGGRIGPSSVDPAYIIVNTTTEVTFKTHIVDSKLTRLHRDKVFLVRTDATGKPVDIVGRMRDNGGKGGEGGRDAVFTLRTTLNERTVGPATFRVAARFAPTVKSAKDLDIADEWDRELLLLSDAQRRSSRDADVSKLLQRYRWSEILTLPVQIAPTYRDPETGLGFALPQALPHASVVKQPISRTDSYTLYTVEALLDGRQESVLTLAVFPNHQRLSLEEWFERNVDTSSILRTAGSFELHTLPSGSHALVRVRDAPTSHTLVLGPVQDGYLITSSGQFAVAISLSHESALNNMLDDASISSLLIDVMSSVAH
jgi:hypothetical protein